ncbi:hypothetical protein, partial [Halorubrum sp. Eb13]|uniref:hypothetical protein n=1 Tax=Halorubrum sp. Eb13 TaxID=1383843 RepID=UPI000B998AA6
ACAVLAAGALEMFPAGLISTVYNRAAGALEMFPAGLISTVYNRAAGVLEVFVPEEPLTYLRAATTLSRHAP